MATICPLSTTPYSSTIGCGNGSSGSMPLSSKAFRTGLFGCKADAIGGLGTIAGIDRHHGAGDIAALFADQEFDGISYVINLGEPSQSAAPQNLSTLFGAQAPRHLGVHKTGRNRIDVYPEGTELAGERTREADH